MDLMRILRSLEEFLYELVGWLVFYPRTFWRVLRHPAAMARYTRAELLKPEEDRFEETISPVLMLILSVVLAHALEVLTRVDLPDAQTPAAQILFGTQQGLLLTRCVVFCLFALVAALVTLRQQGSAVTRDTLRLPFSIQAFLVSPFVLLTAVAFALPRMTLPHAGFAAGACLALSLAWYVWARASAYRAMVGGGWVKSLAIVVAGLLLTTTLVVLILWIVVGSPMP